MSQEELAEKANVHPNTIARWERDELDPRGASISKIADALKVSPAELLNGEIDNNLGQEPTYTPQPKTEDRGMLTYEINGQKLQVPDTPENAGAFWARVDKLIGLQYTAPAAV